MTIILFLLDTSASMNQSTYVGLSVLDIAKTTVDTFVKLRARDQQARGSDRFMLLTFDEPPFNVRAGWKESQAVFAEELKAIDACALTTTAQALGNAFHLLNVNRFQTGIDNFGLGRYPNWIEPAVVILITDGGPSNSPVDLADSIVIPRSPSLGSELVDEAYRWDQRVFAIVLRIPSDPAKNDSLCNAVIDYDSGPLEHVCRLTGGRSYRISNVRAINQCVELLLKNLQTGVLIALEKFGPDPTPPTSVVLVDVSSGDSTPLAAHDSSEESAGDQLSLADLDQSDAVECLGGEEINGCRVAASPTVSSWLYTRKLLLIPRAPVRGYTASHWPIPENFLPDYTMSTLPARAAIPVVKFSCHFREFRLFADFPFDKYELQPSALTEYMLDLKQPTMCWYTYMPGSNGVSELGAPFGFLKASWTLNSVSLFVLPYDFPTLFLLLDELKKVNNKLSSSWMNRFEAYLKSVPPYYLQPLKSAMQRVGLSRALPEITDNFLNVNLLVYLSNVKSRAKEEYQCICSQVGQKEKTNEFAQTIIQTGRASAELAKEFNVDLAWLNAVLQDPVYQQSQTAEVNMALRDDCSSLPPCSNAGFVDGLLVVRSVGDQLLSMKRMTNFLCTADLNLLEPVSLGLAHVSEDLHNLPVSQMGNYQEYLKQRPASLRELEPAPIRQHAFGNPFKVDRRMLVDEADIGVGFQFPVTNYEKSARRDADAVNGSSSAAIGGGRCSSPDGVSYRRDKGPVSDDYFISTRRKEPSFGMTCSSPSHQQQLGDVCPKCHSFLETDFCPVCVMDVGERGQQLTALLLQPQQEDVEIIKADDDEVEFRENEESDVGDQLVIGEPEPIQVNDSAQASEMNELQCASEAINISSTSEEEEEEEDDAVILDLEASDEEEEEEENDQLTLEDDSLETSCNDEDEKPSLELFNLDYAECLTYAGDDDDSLTADRCYDSDENDDNASETTYQDETCTLLEEDEEEEMDNNDDEGEEQEAAAVEDAQEGIDLEMQGAEDAEQFMDRFDHVYDWDEHDGEVDLSEPETVQRVRDAQRDLSYCIREPRANFDDVNQLIDAEQDARLRRHMVRWAINEAHRYKVYKLGAMLSKRYLS